MIESILNGIVIIAGSVLCFGVGMVLLTFGLMVFTVFILEVWNRVRENRMSEEFTCIECETLYDDTDGDTDERMCNECLDKIYGDEPDDVIRPNFIKQVDGLVS